MIIDRRESDFCFKQKLNLHVHILASVLTHSCQNYLWWPRRQAMSATQSTSNLTHSFGCPKCCMFFAALICLNKKRLSTRLSSTTPWCGLCTISMPSNSCSHCYLNSFQISPCCSWLERDICTYTHPIHTPFTKIFLNLQLCRFFLYF